MKSSQTKKKATSKPQNQFDSDDYYVVLGVNRNADEKKTKLRKPIESSRFSGTQIRTLTTQKKLRKFLRKLVRLMQSCQIKINVRFSTNTAKRD